ncbi:MAG: carboxypeptidase regulatory-like domain-containing protein [Elusimicrobiota bacterium]
MNAFLRLPSRPNIRNARGVTLVELMVAMAILTIGILGLTAAFGSIQKAVQVAKTKTLASNLAQEQLQILSELGYYQLLVTPAPATVAGTNIPYDSTYFPPQTVLQGGIQYTWYTCVYVVEEINGVIQKDPPSTPDTGLRLVTMSVTWSVGGVAQQATVNKLVSNPNTVMSDAIFNGHFYDKVTGNAIQGGNAAVVNNWGWHDTTNASGFYSINVLPGAYTMAVSANGYFSQYPTVTVGAKGTTSTDFNLQPMSSGTVTGTVWTSSSVVISQVVADSYTWCQNTAGAVIQADVEYIEFFNPTPSPIYMGATDDYYYTNYNSLWYYSSDGSGAYEFKGDNSSYFDVKYVSTTIPAYSYFLYANTPRFLINGTWVTADAYFTRPTALPDIPHYLSANASNAAAQGANASNSVSSGYVVWAHYPSGPYPQTTTADSVGWSDATNDNSPPWWTTSLVSTPTIKNCGSCGYTSLGSPKGNQIVRLSSPTAGAYGQNNYGHAYDSQNNQFDFVSPSLTFSGITYQPHNVSSGTFPVIAGMPASGAVITSNDPLSNSTVAYITTAAGRPPMAAFTLVGVATATWGAPWTVLITSRIYTLEADSVTVPLQGNNYNFVSSMTVLSTQTLHGFIAGSLTDVNGVPISSPKAITVTGGGSSTLASSTNGRYLLRVSSGSVDVFANATGGSNNGSYVTVSSSAVTVQLGQVSDGVNFLLSQGGQISGFVTRDGYNALPGITVAAIDANGYERDTEVSDNSGKFTTVVMATGAYTIQPVLDTLEVASPTSYPATITVTTPGVFSTTFTISNAMGVVSGTATPQRRADLDRGSDHPHHQHALRLAARGARHQFGLPDLRSVLHRFDLGGRHVQHFRAAEHVAGLQSLRLLHGREQHGRGDVQVERHVPPVDRNPGPGGPIGERKEHSMVKRARAGYSLVEVMMVVAIVGVVASVGARTLLQVNRYFLLTQTRLDLQKEARAALYLMSREIRGAQSASIVIDRASATQPFYSRITFTNVQGTQMRFQQNGNQLQKIVNNGTVVLSKNLTYLAFTFPRTDDMGILSVALTLQESTYQGQVKALHMASESVQVMN